MASSKSILSEQKFVRERSDLIRPIEAHYLLAYPKGELLNNILTRVRVLSGVATVYQRDTIKKKTGRNYVPIEIGFVMPPGYGGREKFESDLIESIRKIKGIGSLSKIRKQTK